jgi:hypothetical protein
MGFPDIAGEPNNAPVCVSIISNRWTPDILATKKYLLLAVSSASGPEVELVTG